MTMPGNPDDWPDRPKHPDFARISEVVIELDSQPARNPRYQTARELAGKSRARYNPFYGLVDAESVSYMAKGRQQLALKHFASGLLQADSIEDVMQALWMEAFACGVMFERNGGTTAK